MAKTTFSTGTVVTKEFLNSIFNTGGGHVHDGGSNDGSAAKVDALNGAEITNISSTPTAGQACMADGSDSGLTLAGPFRPSGMIDGARATSGNYGGNPIGPNLLFNSSFRDGSKGWTGDTDYVVVPDGDALDGYVKVSSTPVAAKVYRSTKIPWGAADTINLSLDFYGPDETGTFQAALECYNAGDVLQGTICTTNATASTSWHRKGTSGTTPANTAYVKVLLNCASTTHSTYIAWSRIKVEPGNISTVYTAEGDNFIARYGIKNNFGVDTGAADAYVLSVPGLIGPTAGDKVYFQATNANTGASTINVNGGGAVAITKKYDDPLEAGDILDNHCYQLMFDGTQWQLLNPSRYMQGMIEVFTSSGTFNAPKGVTHVKVRVVGPGGGGSGDIAGSSIGGFGGGGGGYAEEIVTLSSLEEAVTVTVGTGGAGGASTASGSDGSGPSSFGAYCSASAGTGGNVGSGSGAGGVGSNGDINASGSDGNVATGAALAYGGFGGGSMLGGSAKNSANGKAYGGGGGGGDFASTPDAGGDGADGIVIVEW